MSTPRTLADVDRDLAAARRAVGALEDERNRISPPELWSAAFLAEHVNDDEVVWNFLEHLDSYADPETLTGYAVDVEAAGALILHAREVAEAALTQCADAIRKLPEHRS